MFRRFVLGRLQKYVKLYFASHPEVKLVVLAGSVGKTSTKRAVATLLSERYRVRMDDGSHSTDIAVPLSVLGIRYPEKARSPIAWLAVLRAAKQRASQPADVDVIVQELGTHYVGYVAGFAKYINPDIALVTAVTPSMMGRFGSIEAIAKEQLSVTQYSKFSLINRDDIEGRFAEFQDTSNFNTYGTSGVAEYRFEQSSFSTQEGYRGNVFTLEYDQPFEIQVKVYGEHSLRPIVGAVAVTVKLGVTPAEIVTGLLKVRPVPGRMNVMNGIEGTTIIDDSYDSSPVAAFAAMQALYSFDDDNVPQRIAVLGDMTELGDASQDEHAKLGALCDPDLLSWVVVVGPESEKYLAPAARARGCQVYAARDAIEAGKFVRSVTDEGALILVKGSKDSLYLEECVKILCNMSEDDELVRQTPEWITRKDEFFSRYK